MIENWRHYNTVCPHSSLGSGGACLASRKTGSADAGSKLTFQTDHFVGAAHYCCGMSGDLDLLELGAATARLGRAKAAPKGLGKPLHISRPRLTFREQLVGGFVQMPLGALSIWQVSNQLSGRLVNVHASQVVDLLSLEIEDGRPKDDRYVDTTAVEYFSVHDLPPIEGAPRQRLRLLGSDSETNRTRAISPSPLAQTAAFARCGLE